MQNWIDLSNLPRRKDGKISWKDCDHNKVNFCYREFEDVFYIERRLTPDSVLVRFHDSEIPMDILSIQRVCLGKLYGFSVKDNYHFAEGDIIGGTDHNLQIIKQIRIHYSNNKSSKGYLAKCLSCDRSFQISEANLERGDGCGYCSHHKPKRGETDLWTTRPDVAMMLKYPDHGYSLMEYSNVLETFVCPKCGKEIRECFVHNVSRYGLSCPYCGDKVSYPNRLMRCLLDHLGENFQTEMNFDWCRFSAFDGDKESTGRYDFVIPSKHLIVEMDGGLGHGNAPHPLSRYSKEELIYRDNMKDVLANANGYDVIRIDCNYSSSNGRLSYCRKNILESKLSTIYDLNSVDWTLLSRECA